MTSGVGPASTRSMVLDQIVLVATEKKATKRARRAKKRVKLERAAKRVKWKRAARRVARKMVRRAKLANSGNISRAHYQRRCKARL